MTYSPMARPQLPPPWLDACHPGDGPAPQYQRRLFPVGTGGCGGRGGSPDGVTGAECGPDEPAATLRQSHWPVPGTQIITNLLTVNTTDHPQHGRSRLNSVADRACDPVCAQWAPLMLALHAPADAGFVSLRVAVESGGVVDLFGLSLS